jgi:hypothetical protein
VVQKVQTWLLLPLRSFAAIVGARRCWVCLPHDWPCRTLVRLGESRRKWPRTSRPYGLGPPSHFFSAKPRPRLPCGRCCVWTCHGVRCDPSCASASGVHPGIVKDADEHFRDHRPKLVRRGGRVQAASTDGSATLMRFCPLQRLPVVPRCPGRPATGRSRCDVRAGLDRPDEGRVS